MAADINTRTIISAAWTLYGRRSKWPTAEAIAEYLRAPLDEVERLLRELRRKRVFDAPAQRREGLDAVGRGALMAYAKGTKVSVESSRAELEKILARYGADAFSYGADGNHAIIAFRAQGKHVKFELTYPHVSEFRYTRTTTRTPNQQRNARDQRIRELWRSLCSSSRRDWSPSRAASSRSSRRSSRTSSSRTARPPASSCSRRSSWPTSSARCRRSYPPLPVASYREEMADGPDQDRRPELRVPRPDARHRRPVGAPRGRRPYRTIYSVWKPTEEERKLLAEGGAIELGIVGEPIPPVSLAVRSAEDSVPVGEHPFKVEERA
jgi:hypothetical protein